ncbi:MAG: hypothetical protein R3A79_24325 [Nannocystaceae bacterium]
MSPRRRLARAALVVVAAAATSCADEELVVIGEEGERLDVHFDDRFELCAGTVAAYDRGIVSVAEQLDLDVDSFEHMTFTWLDRPDYEDASAFFLEDATGWAWGSKSYGTRPYMFHEAVHMVSQQEVYDANVLLVEGLATAFEDDGGVNTRVRAPGRREDPRPYVGKRHGEMSYSVAGHFVTYLLGRFGTERFWELYRAVGYLATGGRFRRRFRAIYGLDLDEAVDDYMNNETCPEDAQAIPLPPSCAAPELPWRGDVWVVARALDCGDDDVAGGGSPMGYFAEAAATVTIPEAGDYRVADGSDPTVLSVLTRCGGCPWLNEPLFLDGESRVFLEAGTYSLVSGTWDPARPLVAVAIAAAGDGPAPAEE